MQESEAVRAAKKNIDFHIQIAAAPRPLNTKESRWKQHTYLVEVLFEDNQYKYQVRNFSSLQQAFEARLRLQSMGFPDAFIVAYQNEQRISLEEAKRELDIQ